MNWLPWRAWRALAWLHANRRAPVALLRFLMRPPRHRILISTTFFGGVGGTEKHLKALIEAMPDCLFHVRARELRVAGFTPATANFVVNWPLPAGQAFDLYLYFAGGGKPEPEFGRHRFRKSLLETNGADVRAMEGQFDHIAVQTGHFAKYCTQREKCIPAFPDVPSTFAARREAVELPARFFLTVFNPFSDALKGTETLYRAADAAAMPIVWCFSDKSGFDFSGLPEHPNIIKKKNLSQAALYYAYEHANAYVSFSHMESFGWSLAEAFYLGLPIISREVGFLTYVKGQPGILLYDTEDELRTALGRTDYPRQDHDDSIFRDNAFPVVIGRILS